MPLHIMVESTNGCYRHLDGAENGIGDITRKEECLWPQEQDLSVEPRRQSVSIWLGGSTSRSPSYSSRGRHTVDEHSHATKDAPPKTRLSDEASADQDVCCPAIV